MRNEAFAEFDGIAGGKMGPLGTDECRKFGVIFPINSGSISIF